MADYKLPEDMDLQDPIDHDYLRAAPPTALA